MTTTEAARDIKLEAFHKQLLVMADTLIVWLDNNYSYSAYSIFFLSGVLMQLIQEGWPDEATRPPIYNELIEALDDLGAELGPMIVAVQLDGIPAPKKTVAAYRREQNGKSVN